MKQKPLSWQSKLLAWYCRHRRDLPWRRTKDPYAVWVSEIMLQQTTVEAVIPYYQRFLKRFPSVRDLAAADEEEVLGLWSGLGYYSRARNLHKAAKIIKKIPETIEELMQLPGIGRYTAGAIASIAFERRAPIVDGNVIRVLSRIFGILKDPKSAEGKKVFWKKAEEILPFRHCGDFNQALMELGAMICSPENPSCLLCPVSSFCAARRAGRQEEFPVGKKKVVYREVFITAAVIEKEGKVLLTRRKSEGLLKSLWEFPMVEGGIESLLREWPAEVIRPLASVRHSVLNRRLRIEPFLCRPRKDWKPSLEVRWLDPDCLGEFPTSSMNHKIIEQLRMRRGGT